MNTARKFFFLLAAGCLLGACASTPKTAVHERQGAYKDVNQEYVAAVERGARIRGVAVHWINPPREADRAD